eukprot:761413-Hanusia_phi.AAC.2
MRWGSRVKAEPRKFARLQLLDCASGLSSQKEGSQLLEFRIVCKEAARHDTHHHPVESRTIPGQRRFQGRSRLVHPTLLVDFVWHQRLRYNAEEERERFSRYRKIVARQVVQDQKAAFRRWQLHYSDWKHFNLVHGRLQSKSLRTSMREFLHLWTFVVNKTSKLIKLHLKLSTKNKYRLLIEFYREWNAQKAPADICLQQNAILNKAFDEWIHSHIHNVVRANKLLGLMNRWDQRTVSLAFQACISFTGWSKRVREVIRQTRERRDRETARGVVSLWSDRSKNQRRLVSHGRQLAIRVHVRNSIKVFETWNKFARQSKALEVSVSRLQIRHEKRRLGLCHQVWLDVTSDTSRKALAISRKDARYVYNLNRSMFQYWWFMTEDVKANLKKNSKAYSHFEQNSYLKYFERWLLSYHWHMKIRHLQLRTRSSQIFRATDDHFAEWLNLTLRGRALRIHYSAVSVKIKKALCQDGFHTWFAEKCRLRKCRKGFTNLSKKMITNSKLFHFDEWVLDTSLISRHSRISAFRFEKYCEQLVSDVFEGWKSMMRCIVSQSKGIERLRARYSHRLLATWIAHWVSVIDRMASTRSKVFKCDKKRLSEGCKTILLCWTKQAEHARITSQRCSAMNRRLERKRLRLHFVFWSEYARQTVEQVNSIEKFTLRQSNGMLLWYIQEWLETIRKWKEWYSRVTLAQRNADLRRKQESFAAMWSLVVERRNIRKVEERRKRSCLVLAASSWGLTARNFELRRKGVERMLEGGSWEKREEERRGEERGKVERDGRVAGGGILLRQLVTCRQAGGARVPQERLWPCTDRADEDDVNESRAGRAAAAGACEEGEEAQKDARDALASLVPHPVEERVRVVEPLARQEDGSQGMPSS